MWTLPCELWDDEKRAGIVELTLKDSAALADCASPSIFRFLSRVPRSWDQQGMLVLLEELLASPNSKFYTIRRGNDRSQVCGMTAYLDVSEYNRRLEIGWTWLASGEHRSGLNRHIKNLMLDYAFQNLQALRVTLTCDVRNTVSQRAIEGIGAQREGLLRRYGRMPDGFQRDVYVYSIVRDDRRARTGTT